MFSFIGSAHVDYAREVVGDHRKTESIFHKLDAESPGLAQFVQGTIMITGEEYHFAHREAGRRGFKKHMAWILACLYSAYGKFPVVDSVWCEKYIAAFRADTRATALQRIYAIHKELHNLNEGWMQLFCSFRNRGELADEEARRIFLAADVFLKAAEEEEHRAELKEYRGKNPSVATFIDEEMRETFDTL